MNWLGTTGPREQHGGWASYDSPPTLAFPDTHSSNGRYSSSLILPPNWTGVLVTTLDKPSRNSKGDQLNIPLNENESEGFPTTLRPPSLTQGPTYLTADINKADSATINTQPRKCFLCLQPGDSLPITKGTRQPSPEMLPSLLQLVPKVPVAASDVGNKPSWSEQHRRDSEN